MSSTKRRRLDGQWVAHRAEMRRSAAWQALSFNALRLILRLELEHLNHGGAENGMLACTYNDFVLAGIRRQSIAPAIREASALGFIVVTRHGYRAASGFNQPSLYFLTYLNGCGKSLPPTDNWQAVQTITDATLLVQEAERQAKRRFRPPPFKAASAV